MSANLEQVRQGELVVIAAHDRPVAKLTAIAADDALGLPGDIGRLQRNGMVWLDRMRNLWSHVHDEMELPGALLTLIASLPPLMDCRSACMRMSA